MLVRLLLLFVAFGVLTSALVGVVLAQRGGGLANVVLVVLVAGLILIAPAWLLARSFVRPFRELREGAERIAGGDYGHRVQGGVWRDSRELARSFNEMSTRLAGQIDRLEAERGQLRAILGGMAEGVVAVGEGHRVLFANAAAGKMLEFDPTGGIGRPLYEMVRQPAVQAIIERAFKTGQPQREEMEFHNPASRHVRVYIAPLSADGEPAAVLVLDDTSELRRLERLRQDFVANVSHELKTPLAVVKTCVETLLDGAVEDAKARGPFLHQIADQTDRLHALILDLLSLARIESGEEAMHFQVVSVRDAVARCLDRHRPRAESKRSSLDSIPPGAEMTVWADEEALDEILDNLVDNAVKYTQEGGTIRVRWQADANRVCLSVEDNGPGIPARDLPRIFERFYRVDRARSRELGGTGLGLSIVKHLAQAMGGAVRAASEVDKGTTLTVTLPQPGRAL
jgi:two-component system, OmpR family, phosphate regulon sensor histidine kinase PhoR